MIIAFDTVSRQIGTLDGAPGEPDFVVWTSHLYPIEIVEALNVSATARSGWMFPNPLDAMDVGATLVGGTLVRVIGFVEHTAPPDSLDVSATLVDGTLVRVIGFVEHTVPPDSLDVGATLIDGTLRLVLVTTEFADSLDVSATLIAGTLE